MATFLHVGFSNTGTTSLQRFFANRPDLFFAGEPYGDRGGLFTAIRSLEDFRFDGEAMMALCHRQIFVPSSGRPVVISDETMTEAPQLYFHPFVMPRDTISMRLKTLFPGAKIILTIREQRERVVSMYFNLKRNHARFSAMPMAPFRNWFEAMTGQVRSTYLHNLDYSEMVDWYAKLFGPENVRVLPLEMLTQDGPLAYLQRLGSFMDIKITKADAEAFTTSNRRMSEAESLAADALPDTRATKALDSIRQALGDGAYGAALASSPPATLSLEPQQQREIRKRVEKGNAALAERFSLDLERYGYYLPSTR